MKFNQYIATQIETHPDPQSVGDMYLDLVKRSLTRALVAKKFERQTIWPGRKWLRIIVHFLRRILAPMRLELVRLIHTDALGYLESGDAALNRAEDAESMLGTRQFDHMQRCIDDIIEREVPGDLLEAGVWRGGMTMFMRAALKARGDDIRRVFVVDSFAGLPTPNEKIDSNWWKAGDMSVSLGEVRENFARYNLLDDKVVFIKGFFAESLPHAPINELSILRIDADLYDSTLDVLNVLYEKLSVGGYVVIDDYQNLRECQRAVDEFRTRHGISEELVKIDTRAVHWVKER